MPTPTVGVLVIKGDEVLLVRHEKGSGYKDNVYGLPSGRLRPDEKEITAAARELREETGLVSVEANLVEFPGNFYIAKLPNRKNPEEAAQEWSWRVFLCKKFEGKLQPSRETTPVWIGARELENLYLLPNVQNAVAAGIKFIRNN